MKINGWKKQIIGIKEQTSNYETEVNILSGLSEFILEEEYIHLFQGQSDCMILEAIQLIGYKMRLPHYSQKISIQQKQYLSISYGIMFLYLASQLLSQKNQIPQLNNIIKQELNQSDILEMLATSIRLATNNKLSIQLTIEFISQFITLLKQQSQLFQENKDKLEQLIISSVQQEELLVESSEVALILAELLGNLPLIEEPHLYSQKVSDLIHKAIGEFFYGFQILQLIVESKQIHQKAIQQSINNGDSFKNSKENNTSLKETILEWDSLSNKLEANTDAVRMIFRMKWLQQLVRSTMLNIRDGTVHQWSIDSQLKCIEQILGFNQNQSKFVNPNSIEALASIKIYSLKILNDLICVCSSSFVKYSVWLNNTIQSTLEKYSTQNQAIVKQLLKISIQVSNTNNSILNQQTQKQLVQLISSLLLSHFGEILKKSKKIINSTVATVQDEMNFRREKKKNKHTTKGVASLVRIGEEEKDRNLFVFGSSNKRIIHYGLQLIEVIYNSSLSSEQQQNINDTFKKIISYPKIIAISSDSNKYQLFKTLSHLILEPVIHLEEQNKLASDFQLFVQHYRIAETNSQFVNQVIQISQELYSLRQSKRLNFVDNSIDLQNYFEARVLTYQSQKRLSSFKDEENEFEQQKLKKIHV